jgi:hypothetical protein
MWPYGRISSVQTDHREKDVSYPFLFSNFLPQENHAPDFVNQFANQFANQLHT